MTQPPGRSSGSGKADLHVHTSHGDGMAEPQQLLDYIEEHTDLDLVAITDHDDIEGALALRELWALGRYSFSLLTGTEITTREGHLLALDIDQPLKPFRPLAETIGHIRRSGGFCVIPHPMSWLTRSVGRNGIDRIVASPDPEIAFDGIELMNQSPAGKVALNRVRAINQRQWRLSETGGSDAHFLHAVGTAYTTYPGHTLADLRAALTHRQTGAGSTLYPTLRQLGVGTVIRQQWRGLMVTPRKAVIRPLSRRLREQNP